MKTIKTVSKFLAEKYARESAFRSNKKVFVLKGDLFYYVANDLSEVDRLTFEGCKPLYVYEGAFFDFC